MDHNVTLTTRQIDLLMSAIARDASMFRRPQIVKNEYLDLVAQLAAAKQEAS